MAPIDRGSLSTPGWGVAGLRASCAYRTDRPYIRGVRAIVYEPPPLMAGVFPCGGDWKRRVMPPRHARARGNAAANQYSH